MLYSIDGGKIGNVQVGRDTKGKNLVTEMLDDRGSPIEHDDYNRYGHIWKRCRDCYQGEDAVKNATTIYLPALSGFNAVETDKINRNYLQRAVFYNYVRPVVNAMVGSILRKDPTVEGTPTNVTDELNHRKILHTVIKEIVLTGRVFCFINNEDGKADIAFFKSEDILNWYEKDDVKEILLRINEEEYVIFTSVGTVFTQTFLTKIENVWKQEQTKPIDTGVGIPGVVFNADSDVWLTPSYPPINDLALMNIAHYRDSADKQHILHYSALPTPYISGSMAQGTDDISSSGQVTLGPTSAILLDPGSTIGVLEFQGSSITALERAMEQKEKQIGFLGGKLLDNGVRGAETAEALKVRQTGEGSVLSQIANNIESTYNQLLVKISAVYNESKSISIDINKDFFNAKMSPQELSALVNAYTSGVINPSIVEFNLRQGEMVPEDVTSDDVIAYMERQIV